MKDLYSDIKPLDASNDEVIDLDSFLSATFIYNATGATTVKIQESDNNSTDFTDVSAEDYLGEPIDGGAGVYKFGYRGDKRYLKCVVGSNVSGMCVLGHYIHGIVE